MGGQRWADLSVLPVGQWEPKLTVEVVIPARDCQEDLDRTLAALSVQTYPQKLLRVVVVDDASSPPLVLPELRPESTRFLRLDEAQSHGSGRARHAGAQSTTADVVLFLDADMVADRDHVDAHARWHHATSQALVLGRKWFVDFSGITPSEVAAHGPDGLGPLLEGRRQRGHVWQEDFIASQDNLSIDSDDAFIAVVGANISIKRSLYKATGGFSAFGLRGIVDTEFGYRAYASGALIVPDDEAISFHQGARNFSSRGDEIKRLRTGLAANYLPIPLFRQSVNGRQWAVPMVNVFVDSRAASPEDVQITVDSVLASTFSDLVVTVIGSDLPAWLTDYLGHDGRVTFLPESPPSAFPSPFTGAVDPGLLLEQACVQRSLTALDQAGVGAVRTHPSQLGGRQVGLWRTRSLLRAASTRPVDLDKRVAELAGEQWLDADTIGVAPGVVELTKQGMLVGTRR